MCNARPSVGKQSSSASVHKAKITVYTQNSFKSREKFISLLQLIHCVSIQSATFESSHKLTKWSLCLANAVDQDIVLFARELDGNSTTNLFSVSTCGRESVKYRCVVYYIGPDNGTGSWRCDKDGDNGCRHVTKARHHLQQLVQRDPSARDPSAGAENDSGALRYYNGLFLVLMVRVPGVHSIGVRSARSVISVSHLPVPLPVWALLPHDNPIAREQRQPVLQVPCTISLDEGARCICGSSPRTTEEILLRECVVYTLINAQRMLLEVQPCQTCPQILRRFIGPDSGRQGIFNLNHSVLFTHDILDDYTANFTSSETPFSAWVNMMRKRYACHNSPLPFAHEAVFRNAWFSYSSLQQFDGDMKCPKCGPAPDDVIWDGVSLSFHRKHLLSSLCPPTMIHEKSLIRNSRYHIQAPIRMTEIRRAMRKIMLISTGCAPASESNDVDSGDNTLVDAVEKVAQDASSLAPLIFKTHESLKSINESLAACFYSHISLTALNSGVSQCKEYTNFFLQVRGYMLNWCIHI